MGPSAPERVLKTRDCVEVWYVMGTNTLAVRVYDLL